MKYKQHIILVSFLLTFQNVFAQCTEQKNFDVNWNIDGYNIAYTIKRKDLAEFSYYKYGKNFAQHYNGIKIDEFKNKRRVDSAIYMGYTNYESDFDRVTNLLLGNNNQFSLYTNSMRVSQIYTFPFEKNMFLHTKIITDKFNLENAIYSFTSNNTIYWRQKIKYYIILFHDEYGRECSYFESPEIKYNFGIKPGSLIWKEFWSKS